MKKYFLILALCSSFLSCEKDEPEVTCTVSDFVGTWKVTGSEACILNDATTLKITDLGANKIQGVYTGNGVESDFDAWTVDGCTFTGKVQEIGFIDVTIKGTLADGKLKIVNTGTFLGTPVNCTENLTK
jgi:hypothetical protein